MIIAVDNGTLSILDYSEELPAYCSIYSTNGQAVLNDCLGKIGTCIAYDSTCFGIAVIGDCTVENAVADSSLNITII